MAEGKRYYWLKLQRDFFKRHDTVLLKKIHGSDALLFYLELMAESVDHEGELRYSADQPYTADMLRVLFEEDRAEEYLEILKSMGLVKIKRDKTIILPKVTEMMGSAADNDNARRQKRYRDNQKLASVTKNNGGVTQGVTKNNESKSIELEKELDFKEEKKKEKKPTLEEVTAYAATRKKAIDPAHFYDYYQAMDWKIKGHPITDWKAKFREWERSEKEPIKPSYDLKKVMERANEPIVYKRKQS